jgi:putative phosphoserine phosphatase/1-acylglycerol-3-phosphate O-acyltransferase
MVITADEQRLAELAAVQRDIRVGPKGPAVGAFFDFDGTVVHGFKRGRRGWAMFQRKLRQKRTSAGLTSSLLVGLSGQKSAAHVKRIDRLIRESWRGRRPADFELVERRLFTRFLAGRLYPEAWQLIREHLSAGHTVVIASAGVCFQIRVAARELGVEHVLCTEPAIEDGVLTGEIDGDVLWGNYKADAVKTFASSNGVELARSYAYSNASSDVSLLSVVGKPIAVNPDRGLAAVAARRNWRVLRFRWRGHPGFYRIVRTVLAVVGFCIAAGAAMLCSLGQGRRTAVDRTYAWVSTAVLRCAGVRVRVTGADHLRATRPAVFVFNHQSQIDTFVVPYLLRTAITGVVKQQVKHYPLIGPVLRFIGVTFVDLSSPGQGRRAVEPLVAQLESSISVMIAPEGRVSPTPQLLPFKKGAFHLAAQARVPIIPMVIRNAGDVIRPHAAFVRPGTIEVAILDPIDVGSWRPETLDQQIEQLRQLYLDTLTHWPQTPTQRPKGKWWWAIRTTPRSGGSSAPTLRRLAAAQSGDGTTEFTTRKPGRQAPDRQPSIDVDAEAM